MRLVLDMRLVSYTEGVDYWLLFTGGTEHVCLKY